MSATIGPLPPEPALVAALVEDACAHMRCAAEMTPRMNVALPDALELAHALEVIAEQAGLLVRFLRRRAEEVAWLTDGRPGVDVTDTLDSVGALWESAVETLHAAADHVAHLRREVDLSDHGYGPAVVVRADRPSYRSDTVPTGPFGTEPFALERLLRRRSNGTWREPHHRDACAAAWLTDALDAAGVVLGAHDRFTATLLAGQGTSTAQVVAGWVARSGARSVRDDAPS